MQMNKDFKYSVRASYCRRLSNMFNGEVDLRSFLPVSIIEVIDCAINCTANIIYVCGEMSALSFRRT